MVIYDPLLGMIEVAMAMIEILEWSERFKLGHKRIDSDHQKLIALINQLSDAMTKRVGKEACCGVLQELVSYFQTHFAMEEDLMARHNYSQSAAHKAEHVQFVKQVEELQAKFETGSVTLSISLLNFLRNWLANHILMTDKALVAALPSE